ncbi:cell division protein FtsQ/DivIB [Fusobacterium varium]|uniref:cell division protein FtsQ/DivIB n=1 Tax=Fusobacterium varium TaxID=856 RepID=UPI000BBAB042|nr:cell division protein FtsQ/DivIB [uncultured Fusobacterium sp.]BBA53145.1 cell division protein FtsQ [Fusobacterium varium]
MKFIIRLFTILGISFLIFSIPSKFLKLDFFKIKRVNVKGDPKLLLRELTELGKTTYNNNIWDLDFKSIEDELKKDVRVKNASVENNTLGELTISIEEKELFYYAQIKDKIYLVDSEGVVFGTFNEKEKKDIPLISVKEKEEIKSLLNVLVLMDDYLLKELVSQIYIKDKNCIEIILVDGTIIKTNEEIKREKYKVVETLYSELVKSKKVEYIDLRFNDFIVKSLGDKSDDR